MRSLSIYPDFINRNCMKEWGDMIPLYRFSA